jgi:hypothetical protein
MTTAMMDSNSNRLADFTFGWADGLCGLTAEAVPGRVVYAVPAERP